MKTIAAVCNFYCEANALPGWLEMATSAFDEVVCVNAGPGGARSEDGSIEILEKWGVRIEYDTIDEGFGTLRSKLITVSKCDWVAILDADERLHRFVPSMTLNGLDVTVGQPYHQMELLREIIENPNIDAVVTGRRHWHDFTWKRPTQNWIDIADWQARIVRNCEHVKYKPVTRMHEHIVDERTGLCPVWYHPGESTRTLLWYDHYHCHWKPMEQEQRAHDVAIYESIERAEKPPTLREFRDSKGLVPG